MNLPDEAIETARAVLAKCAANDPWFPQPIDATVFAWAEQFMNTNLTREDLLASVASAYASHGDGFKPLPATSSTRPAPDATTATSAGRWNCHRGKSRSARDGSPH